MIDASSIVIWNGIPMHPRRFILYSLTLLSLQLWVFLPVSPIAAHQELERAEPEFDAVLNIPPLFVKLWFRGALDSFESTLAVYDARDRQVDLGDAGIGHEDRRLLYVSLPDDLPPGKYTIRWSAVDDEDAHPVQGEYTITIAGISEAPPGSKPVAILGVGAIILAGGTGIWAWARRKKKIS